jgi:tryptophanase
MILPYAEPYKIKMIESLKRTTRKEREKYIKENHYNLFALKSDMIYIDFLTDSGTGAMSDIQWSEMMKGDESYAGSRSYYKLKEAIKDILGFDYFLPTHQGRAAENVLFSTLVKKGDIIPGNSHFDTTKGHIEFRGARAVDCTIDEGFDTTLKHPFKGNVDINKLENVFKKNPIEQIPFVIVTITNNTGGGQPVSLENIKKVSALCKKYNVRLIIDGARFAENCYFIKTREEKYKEKTIREIVKELFSYVDGMTMSSKKDAIVNMGGFIAMNDSDLFRKASVYNIMFEGFITYGGMNGRDMAALAQGLYEGTEFDYLQSRIIQVEYLGEKLKEYGVPMLEPVGGHAVFLDAKKIFPDIPQKEYPAQLLGVELYIEGGIRGVEIGSVLADRDPETGREMYPELELLRLAVPRRVYTDNHMNFVASAAANILERRDKIKRGLKIIEEAPIMRHFTTKFKKL